MGAVAAARVEPVADQIANAAIDLLQSARLNDYKYTIDAALAAVPLRQPGRVTIFSSDENQMRELCGDHVVVVKL